MFAAFPLGLLCGFIGGFVGAIPPGPIGITCLRRSLLGERREAYAVALGGASVDVLTFSWFTLLIRTAHRLKDRSGPWVARSTTLAGAFLLATGLYFGWRSFAPV